MSLKQTKRTLRHEMQLMRTARFNENPQAAEDLVNLFAATIKETHGKVIAGYVAFRGELDVLALMQALLKRGGMLALPRVVQADTPLEFRSYLEDTHLFPNAFGVLEPPKSAALVEPDILLVPLLAFDANRHRLGYGGGYYDRTIARLREKKTVQAFGIAYPFQQLVSVPHTEFDARLDRVFTTVNVF